MRDTYKYHIKRGNQILHRGITNDLERRHSEHKRNYGSDVTITQIGRRVDRDAGLKWEKDGGKRP
jgi:predicted GIY-YIG superfamily endonuclease